MSNTFRHDPKDNYDASEEEALLERVLDAADKAARRYTDDEKLRKVIQAHLRYESGGYRKETKPRPTVAEDGTKWYRVGHNASHEFSMTVRDNKYWVRAFGPEYMDEDGTCDCLDRALHKLLAWEKKNPDKPTSQCKEYHDIMWDCDIKHVVDRYHEREVKDDNNWGYIGHW